MSSSLSNTWKRFWHGLIGQDTFDIVVTMTLVMILAHYDKWWFERITVRTFCAVALIYRPLSRSAKFWLLLALYRLVTVNYYNWAFSDNHDCLYTYWCMALGCALLLENPQQAIARQGRWMIGLVFLFATIWKVITPVYTSGDMFYFLLYEDIRFHELGHVLSNWTLEVGIHDRSIFLQRDALQPLIPLQSLPNLKPLSQFFTWWTICIEGLIAIQFLLPRSFRMSKWRDPVLILFIITTYVPVGVAGFAQILTVMGIAQTTPDSKKTRLCYFLLFLTSFLIAGGELKRFIFQILLAPLLG